MLSSIFYCPINLQMLHMCKVYIFAVNVYLFFYFRGCYLDPGGDLCENPDMLNKIL